jgi:heptaprenyl diphosphate synthase
VTQVTQHPLRAGGKRLRPALALLGGRFCLPEDTDRLVGLAAAAELIHMATLIHDDMIDGSATRRGCDTVNARWGDRMAVLAGDYLFGCAFTLVARWGNGSVIDSLSKCVTEMAKGEMVQFGRIRRFKETETDYLDWIEKKTAIFIAEASRIGALGVGAPESIVGPLWRFGRYLGLCFQIVDDVLDLTASPDHLGKPAGCDIRNGVTTLPIIHALRESSERDHLRVILQNGQAGPAIDEALAILRRAGSIDYAQSRASDFAAAAHRELGSLPDLPARRSLADMTDRLLHRKR